MDKSFIRELKVGDIVMYKVLDDIINSAPPIAYGVVSEVSDKTFIRWFDTEKNTPYAFNTIHRLLREGKIQIVSRA